MLRAEGPVVVLGGAGLGKSLLGEVIAGELGSRFDIVRLHAARLCSRRALLQSILFELQMPYRGLSEGELRLSILDRLEPSQSNAPDGVLLLVDEAHTLPAKLLDELRLINNFNRNHQPRTRLVLLGNMRLEDTFTDPQMESFNQRLAARCYLQPMNRRDTYAFIQHQLSVAGLAPTTIITNDGLDAIYLASEGVPRLANQLMDHAIILAITNNQCPISAALIQEAWADLQQLPAPWHATEAPASGAQGSIIEFGSLDEAEDTIEEEDTPVAYSAYAPEQDNPTEIDSNSEPVDAPHTVEATELDNAASQSCPLAVQPERKEEASSEVPRQCADSNAECDASEGMLPQPFSLQTSRKASYFANKPTDEELLALEDEQAQYDAMGVWENDPPLQANQLVDLHQVEEHVDLVPTNQTLRQASPDGAQTTIDAGNIIASQSSEFIELFGSDFEDETPIPSSRMLASELQPRPAAEREFGESQANRLEQQRAVEISDYVAHPRLCRIYRPPEPRLAAGRRDSCRLRFWRYCCRWRRESTVLGTQHRRARCAERAGNRSGYRRHRFAIEFLGLCHRALQRRADFLGCRPPVRDTRRFDSHGRQH